MTQDIILKATEFCRDFEPEITNDNKQERLIKTMDFLFEEVRETERAVVTSDLEEIVDGFGDSAFVALNGIYKLFRSLGNDHDTAVSKVNDVMHRICDANLGKKQADGTVLKVNGKVQKPEGWKAPEYKDLVA